jgi:molybdopterin-guanine dinucleotide biosynthesis protein B
VIPIVSVVGKSNSGKTTLLEKLIADLSGRGYRVATVKHDVHGFEIDKEGKDSYRHKQAGSRAVVISSPNKIAIIEDLDQEQSLEQIRRRWIHTVDIILTEGYKRQSYPKIEVNLFQDPPELLCSAADNLIAVVCRRPVMTEVPVFSETQIPELGDVLEERYLKPMRKPRVELWNNEKPIPLNPFAETLIQKTVQGILSALKGSSPEGEVEIRMQGDAGKGKDASREGPA